ncbi:unnamed protein product [Lactuca virosa]|uniref:Reticulon-like protein n=1 Tax=Lactuca virosa TaxID=75947 RepID=A0AAU9LM97_9ASTR|nr:unnamed protein product [Lactuca virosa]
MRTMSLWRQLAPPSPSQSIVQIGQSLHILSLQLGLTVTDRSLLSLIDDKAEFGAMPEGITSENLMNNIMDTLSDKLQKQNSGSFFVEEKSHSHTVSSQFNKLFGRQKPIHHILGGGKSADVLLWRNKKISAGVLCGATAVAPPRVTLPDELFVNIARIVGDEVNRALGYLQYVGSRGDIKQLTLVVGGLLTAAIIGTWCNFWTVIYIGFVAAHTLPVVYEKYDDQIDSAVYNLFGKVQNHYSKLDTSLLSRIPKAKAKKFA